MIVNVTDAGAVVIEGTGNPSLVNDQSEVSIYAGVTLLGFLTGVGTHIDANGEFTTQSGSTLKGTGATSEYGNVYLDSQSGTWSDLNLFHNDPETKEIAGFVTSAGALSGSLTLDLSEESALLPSGGSTGEIWSGNSGNLGVLIGYYTVVVPPSASVTTAASEVTARQSLEIAAGVEGGGPYEYQWKKGGSDLIGATNATYRVETVSTNEAGVYTVRVSNPAGTATSSGLSVSVSQIEQTVEIEAIADQAYSTQTLTLTGTASSGLGVSYRVASGPATVSGNTLSLTGVGTVVVVVSQEGDSDYAAATEESETFVVSQAGQTITFGALADRSYSTKTIALSASASSGLGVSFRIDSGPAAFFGNSLMITGVGTVTVTATQGGNENYLAADAVTSSFNVGKAEQLIAFEAIEDTIYSTNTIPLIGSASSGLDVAFSIESGPAEINGDLITLTGVGTVVVVASQVGDGNYWPAISVANTFVVVALVESQVIAFAPIADRSFMTNAIALVASSDSGLLVSFRVLSGPATVSQSALTLSGVGMVSVVATQLGNGRYLEATPVTNQFEVTRATQAITFASVADRTFSTNSFNLIASADSGLGVSFSVLAGPATLTGNQVTITGVGEVSIVATQSGDANYLAAADVTRTFNVGKASQTITVANISDTIYLANPITLSGSASSGLDLTFAVTSGPATIAGNILTSTGAGTVSVTATQSGDANYLAATPVTKTLNIAKASQTLTAAEIPDTIYLADPISLSGSSSSGLDLTFTVTSGSATIAGNLLTTTGAGMVSVTATQNGDENYIAATAVTKTFNVGKASQTITVADIGETIYLADPITLSGSSSSGLDLTFAVTSGPATLIGNTLTTTAAGIVSVTATQNGNANYLAAVPVIKTFNVGKASQAITVADISDTTFSADTIWLSGTASSGLEVAFLVTSGPATLVGNILTTIGAGIVNVTATQAGDANFLEATPVTKTFNVDKASQTITVVEILDTVYLSSPITLAGIASSGLDVSFELTSGPAILVGSTLTTTGPGVVSVTATQLGNANFLAADQVVKTFNVGKALQVITVEEIADTIYLAGPITLTGTADSGLDVTFAVTSGPATLAGNILTPTGAGIVSVTATQSGDENYLAATPATKTFNVGKASQTITFADIADTTYSANPITLSGSSSSGLGVAFTLTSGPATLVGDILTTTGAGMVSVTATQSGDADYLAATPVIKTFNVGKASQTITVTEITDMVYLDGPITLTGTADSGLDVTFTITSGPATLVGNILTTTGAGMVSVTATQSGDADYLAATPVTKTFNVGKASQTITFADIADTTYSANPITLSGSSSSGLGVAFTLTSGPATLTGNILTTTGAGNVTVTATQTGTDNYLAASPVTVSFQVFSTIIGRAVFYNNSAWDGNNTAANARDDQAIATDKVALRLGEIASFTNYTSYSKGINGIIVDLAGAPIENSITAADFRIVRGNDNNPSGWSLASTPESVTIRPGAGVGGSTRVTLIWADNTFTNTWVGITTLATTATGLRNEDQFYFGNAIGDTGNSSANAQVSIADQAAIRSHPATFLAPAALNSRWDINRDQRVGIADEALARSHITTFLTALKLIDLTTRPIRPVVGDSVYSMSRTSPNGIAIAQYSPTEIIVEAVVESSDSAELWIAPTVTGPWHRSQIPATETAVENVLRWSVKTNSENQQIYYCVRYDFK